MQIRWKRRVKLIGGKGEKKRGGKGKGFIDDFRQSWVSSSRKKKKGGAGRMGQSWRRYQSKKKKKGGSISTLLAGRGERGGREGEDLEGWSSAREIEKKIR